MVLNHLFNKPEYWAARPHPNMVWLAPDFFLFKQNGGYAATFKATFGTPIRHWTWSELTQLKALKNVSISLWPKYLNPEAYEQNCKKLIELGFDKVYTDETHVIDLRKAESWLSLLPEAQRWKIKKAEKLGLQFQESANLSPQQVLQFVKNNRKNKGYPVSIDYPTLCADYEHGNTPDYSIQSINYPDFSLAAIGIVRSLNSEALYTYILADDPNKRQISGTAFLIYQLVKWAESRGYTYLDLGIATDKGVINEGLTAFKKRITDFSSEKAFFRLDA